MAEMETGGSGEREVESLAPGRSWPHRRLQLDFLLERESLKSYQKRFTMFMHHAEL